MPDQTMPNWVMPLFTIVVALALFIEMAVIAATYIVMRRLTGKVEQLAEYAHGKVFPAITSIEVRMEQVQPRIFELIYEASRVVHSARERVEDYDKQIAEASERVMAKVIEADRVASMTLALVEDMGAQTRRMVSLPGQAMKAVIQSAETGVGRMVGTTRRPSGNEGVHVM